MPRQRANEAKDEKIMSSNKFLQNRQIRHNRILDLRKKIDKKWTMPQLTKFCITKLQVSKETATSYINEAAAPYRKKYQEEEQAKFDKKQ